MAKIRTLVSVGPWVLHPCSLGLCGRELAMQRIHGGRQELRWYREARSTVGFVGRHPKGF